MLFDHIDYQFIEDVARKFKTKFTFSYGWIPFYRWDGTKIFLLYRELSKQGNYRRILVAFYRDGEITPSVSANFANNGFQVAIRGIKEHPIVQIKCNNTLGIYESFTDYMYDLENDRCYSLCDNKVMYRYTTEECIRIWATEGRAYNEPFEKFYEELYLSAAIQPNQIYSYVDKHDDNIPFKNNRRK